jgi:hypothetical protein
VGLWNGLSCRGDFNSPVFWGKAGELTPKPVPQLAVQTSEVLENFGGLKLEYLCIFEVNPIED